LSKVREKIKAGLKPAYTNLSFTNNKKIVLYIAGFNSKTAILYS